MKFAEDTKLRHFVSNVATNKNKGKTTWKPKVLLHLKRQSVCVSWPLNQKLHRSPSTSPKVAQRESQRQRNG